MKLLSHALVVLSGGQDSVTCLAWAANRFETVSTISFDYGQRHKVELDCADDAVAAMQSPKFRAKHVLPPVRVNLGALMVVASSALIHGGDVSAPHPLNRALPSSFVPGRNALFLTLAFAQALKTGATAVVTGVCQTDFSGYPDCRLEFVEALERALQLGYMAEGQPPVKILTPLMHLDKAQTFELASQEGALAIVLDHSHTCYEGDHTTPNAWGYGCGQCPACKLRESGFTRWRNGNFNRGLFGEVPAQKEVL